MNIEQAIIEQIRQLPIEKQQEVLLFSQLLKQNILPTLNPNLTPKERSEQWQKWLQSNSHSTHQPLPEEALHRDTMYD